MLLYMLYHAVHHHAIPTCVQHVCFLSRSIMMISPDGSCLVAPFPMCFCQCHRALLFALFIRETVFAYGG